MENRRTKKNISSASLHPPKLTKNKMKNLKKNISINNNDLIESLLNKKPKSNSNKNINIYNQIAKQDVTDKRTVLDRNLKNTSNKGKQTKSKRDKIIQNFHQAISTTKSDQIIVKMLELNETDILNFYTNLEKMIGGELSLQIRDQMSKDIQINQKKTGSGLALCPFCMENKSNCVILLCGHLICHKCGKNINRCKFPCPKCQKPIKYIQYIVD